MKTALVEPGDWDFVARFKLNTLVIGSDPVTTRLVQQLRPALTAPVVSLDPRTPFTLPPAGKVGTLVVQHVDNLLLADQYRLLAWLEKDPGHPRVISTSTMPLMEMVMDGTFLDSLYYRLNMLYVEAVPRRTLPHHVM